MKPKKLLILIISIFLLVGCTSIDDGSYMDLIDNVITSNKNITNTYRKGYKLYLPKGLYVYEHNDYNEYIKGKNENYYLYVDVVSYLNKKENTYTENANAFYSKKFSYNNKSGFIEINRINSKYLVEIVYNYAKIEMMVEEDNIRSSITNAIITLASIHYNDAILERENKTVLNYNENEIDIFASHGKQNSNFLKYVEYDEYDEKGLPDYDVIK